MADQSRGYNNAGLSYLSVLKHDKANIDKFRGMIMIQNYLNGHLTIEWRDTFPKAKLATFIIVISILKILG